MSHFLRGLDPNQVLGRSQGPTVGLYQMPHCSPLKEHMAVDRDLVVDFGVEPLLEGRKVALADVIIQRRHLNLRERERESERESV